jgi:outer membrane protein assembly factor BamD (BamD/ComL family)
MQNEPIITKQHSPKSKKTIIIVVVAVVSVILLTVLTVFIVGKINSSKEQEKVVTIESAAELKQSGIEALKNKDNETARELFEEAKKEFEQLGDVNNTVDMDAQLYLLDYAANQ